MNNVFKNKEELKNAVNLLYNNENLALIKYGNVSNWNVSNITDMNNMFDYAIKFNGDISKYDVSAYRRKA